MRLVRGPRLKASRGLGFDRGLATPDPSGRSRLRYKRFLASGAAGLVGRGTSVLSTVISIPIILRHLGEERYGLWVTVMAMVPMLSFADLGIGNGLITTIARAHGSEDRHDAHRLVSTAFFALTALSVVLGFGFAVAVAIVPWESVFNVTGTFAAVEATPTVAAFAATFLIALPLSVVQKVQLGFQEGFVNSIWQGFGSVAGLLGIVTVVRLGFGAPALVLAATGGPLGASLAQNLWLFFRRRPWLRPRLAMTSRTAFVELRHLGFAFFLMQMMMTLAFASDNFVLSRVRGASSVTNYSIQAQPFLWIAGIAGVFLLPLWPAYGEALARREIDWIRLAFKRSLVAVTLAVAIPVTMLVLFARPLLLRWVGDTVEADIWLLTGLALWTVVSAIGASLSVVLNAAGKVKFQVATASTMGLGGITAKFIGARVWGAPGVIWGTLATYTLLSLIPTAIYVRGWLRADSTP